jgi:hypothetical protein
MPSTNADYSLKLLSFTFSHVHKSLHTADPPNKPSRDAITYRMESVTWSLSAH